jgi:hypothetical protein
LYLLLDTGASGISLSPKIIEKAGLEELGRESMAAKGVGDKPPIGSFRYLASKIRIGDLEFTDCPVSLFKSAKSGGWDGLIGSDFFKAFIVTIDFPSAELVLTPRNGDPAALYDEPINAGTPARGFYRMYRAENHLSIPTYANEQKKYTLFLIDSGATSNLMDTSTAMLSTTTYRDERTTVSGVQGKVNDVSRASQISLVFASFRQDNANMIMMSLEKIGDALGIGLGGILGIPVLSNLKTTIDYREGTVRFDYRR